MTQKSTIQNSTADVAVGRITALYGVRGWVKIQSHTVPRENILHYQPWQVCRDGTCHPYTVAESRPHGKSLVVRLDGIGDRDAAAPLVGAKVCVRRDQFPAAEPGEYYWADLVGLRVVTRAGEELGRVDHLMETGANDVLVVIDTTGRERLIPFLRETVVHAVDLVAGVIEVDWDPAF